MLQTTRLNLYQTQMHRDLSKGDSLLLTTILHLMINFILNTKS